VLESAHSQSSRTKDMTWPQPVEVADIEAAELFAQTPKLQSGRPDMETEVVLICQGAWISRAGDHIGYIICGGYSAVTSDGIIFPECRTKNFFKRDANIRSL